MEIALITLFVLGYAAIALEHPIRINKTATAMILAVGCWVLVVLAGKNDQTFALHQLAEHLSSISEIVFFLLGAMTIVELINNHNGFKIVTDLIKTKSKRKLLWTVGFATFFLSAILDNLTTSIVMVALLRKLIDDRNDRLIFAGMVIIAANAGGAWSPIGDVTTTMLWIGGRVSPANLLESLLIPSIICLLVPLVYQSFFIKGTIEISSEVQANEKPAPGAIVVLLVGFLALLFVPIFKSLTHLPPYMGVLFGLGVLWIVTERQHHQHQDRTHLSVSNALGRIDTSSVLFFLAILLAVGALETEGLLIQLATWLDNTIGNKDVIVTALGLASAIIDNVPLTAASMGMYSLADYPIDHRIWEMMAYAVGTGGSCLIIGSAAGVVVMGMEKIEFIWYLKKITLTALLGYFAGIVTYFGMYALLH